MEIGGKQGSKLTGRMFSKLMDVLSELMMEQKKGIKITDDFTIGVLLWVDDVVSCVEGDKEQENMLKQIDNFAKDHKLQWGNDKCKVMPIGYHNAQQEWGTKNKKMRNIQIFR